MPYDLRHLLCGMFLLFGILGILYHLNNAVVLLDADLPATWGVLFLAVIGLVFWHFLKIIVPEPTPRMPGRDQLDIKGGGKLWR